MSELDRVLSAFKGPERGSALRDDLGDFDSNVVNTQQDPGIAYGGGRQTQQTGMRGRQAGRLEGAYAHIFDGIDPKLCPPWLTTQCLHVLSRFLEETFRNFQQHVRLPSHINPPFVKRCIDEFPIGLVTIPGGSYGAGAFVEVVCFQVPEGRFRGIVTSIGQSAESAAAFSDLEWNITVNGVVVDCYEAIRIQIGDMLHPTPVMLPNLQGGDRICINAASLSAAPHEVLGRLFGWYYPVRSEGGVSIKSTIVD